MSRRSLKNWRVRSRLLLLIIIPTLTAVVLGGSRIVTSVQSALGYQRVEQLANMSYDVTGLAARLEDERDQTLEYIGEGTAGRPGTLSHNTADGAPAEPPAGHAGSEPDPAVDQQGPGRRRSHRRWLSESGPGGRAEHRRPAEAAGAVADRGYDHATAVRPRCSTQYASMIDELLAIDDNIALDSGDPALNNDVRALNLVSLIAEEASEQRGLLAYAFAQEGPFNPQVLSDVTTALEEQNANIAEYNRVATPQQVALYTSSVAGSLVDFASSYELQAIQYGEDGKALNLAPTTANEWVGAMSTGTIGGIDAVQQHLVATTIARASALRRQSIETASIVGAAVLIVLLLSLLLTTVVGRSMVRPLRRLRSGRPGSGRRTAAGDGPPDERLRRRRRPAGRRADRRGLLRRDR